MTCLAPWLSHYWSLLTSCWMLLSSMGAEAVALPLVFVSLITVHIGMFLLVFILPGTLCFLDLVDYFLSHAGGLLFIISSNIFSGPFSFGTPPPIMQSLWDLTPVLLQEILQYQQVGLAHALMRLFLFPWILMCMRLCVDPPKVEFLFPPVLWNSCDQTPLVFKAKLSGCSFSHCQSPKPWNLTWSSELSLLWENLCGVIISQCVHHPPGEQEIGFYCAYSSPTDLLWLLVFGYRISFLVGSNLYLLDGCSAVSDSPIFIKMKWALVFLLHHLVSISSRGILNLVRSWQKSLGGCGRKKLNIRKFSRIFSIKKP